MADTHDFVVDQGSDEALSFDFAPRDLAGASARFQARKSYGDAAAIISGNNTNLMEIVGTYLTVRFPAQLTSAIKFPAEDKTMAELPLVYDMEVVWPDGSIERFVQGTLTLSREVTKNV